MQLPSVLFHVQCRMDAVHAAMLCSALQG
eukprot:COSAG02_NODE_12131_length_1591_cov_11.044379_3_plen_28_part_01